MALAFRSRTHATTGNGVTSNNPGEPAGAANGDILFLFVLANWDSSGGTINDPSGWTLLNTWTGTASNGDGLTTKLYWQRRSGAATTNVTFSPTTTQRYSEASITAWSGAKSSGNPYGATTFSASRNATTGVPDCPSVTTTANSSLVLAFGMGWSGWLGTTGWTAPSGYSAGDSGGGLSITNGNLGVFYKSIATSGTAENPGAFGNPNDTTTNNQLHEGTLELVAEAVLSKTFYFKNATAPGAALHLSLQDGGTPPTAATTTTGWVANTNDPATKTYCRMNAGVEIGRLNAQWVSGVRPVGVPDDTVGDSFRSEQQITGTFAVAPWTITFGVRSVTAAYTGRFQINFKIIAARFPDGSGVEFASANQSTGVTTANLSTSADTVLTASWTPPFTPIEFNAHYLVIQVAVQLTSAGGGNTQDIDFRVGSAYGVVTSDFTPGPMPPYPDRTLRNTLLRM